jgi:putative ABC transport system permease protein
MRHLGLDVTYAFRRFRRQPGSSLAIILTLAIGIGAASAVFAVFNHVLFRPTPGVADPDGLVTVWFQPPDEPRTSAFGHRSALEAFRRQVPSLVDIAFASRDTLPVVSGPGRDAVYEELEYVGSRYLAVLGVRARVGRLFTEEEADVPGHDLALISEAMWWNEFDGDDTVIGRTLHVNGHPFVIVGVVADYRGWGTTRVGTKDIWLPLGAERAASKSVGVTMSQLVARPRPEAALPVIQDQLRAAYAGVLAGLRPDYARFVPTVHAGLTAFESREYAEHLRRIYWLLIGGVGLLMMMACANAANLQLARGVSRQREMALRTAVGGTRWRLARQPFVEATVLAGAAGGLGLAVSVVFTSLFRSSKLSTWAPSLTDVSIAPRVVLFAAVATLLTTLAFGVLPAMATSKADVRGVLQGGGRSSVPRRLRSGLVAAQIAVALVLVAGAGVLGQSLGRLYAVDLGMGTSGVVVARLMPHRIGHSDERAEVIFRETMARLRGQGMRVAFSSQSPLDTASSSVEMAADPSARPVRVAVVRVSSDYFSILQIPIVAGRVFDEAAFDRSSAVAPLPIVANETAIRQWFGGDRTIGRRFILNAGAAGRAIEAELVAIAGDTRSSRTSETPRPRLFNPGLSGLRGGVLVVSAGGSTDRAIAALREAVRLADPGLPLTSAEPLDVQVADALAEQWTLARLSGVVGVIALLLAASGVWAVMSCVVAERTRELGIYIALGAPVRSVRALVIRRSATTVVIGVAVGLAVYWPSSSWLESRLFDLSPVDPATLVAAVVTLCTTALFAAWWPARRATRIDPVVALRAE